MRSLRIKSSFKKKLFVDPQICLILIATLFIYFVLFIYYYLFIFIAHWVIVFRSICFVFFYQSFKPIYYFWRTNPSHPFIFQSPPFIPKGNPERLIFSLSSSHSANPHLFFSFSFLFTYSLFSTHSLHHSPFFLFSLFFFFSFFFFFLFLSSSSTFLTDSTVTKPPLVMLSFALPLTIAPSLRQPQPFFSLSFYCFYLFIIYVVFFF